MQWACWTSWNTGRVSFSRDWEGRQPPVLWWGEDKLPLSKVRQLPAEEYGRHSGYYGTGRNIVFFIGSERLAGVSLASGLYLAGAFNGWDAAIGDEQWLLNPCDLRGHAGYRLSLARTKLPDNYSAPFKFVTGDGHWLPVPEDALNYQVDERGIKNYRFSPQRTGKHLFQFRTPLPLAQSDNRCLYFNYGDGVDRVQLNPGVFLKTLGSSADLGANVTDNATIFRLFAPRAAYVQLYCFAKAEGPHGAPIPMAADANGVWSVRLAGNRHGSFYFFGVSLQQGDEAGEVTPEVKVPDPYAKAVCGPRGPGIVVADTAFAAVDVPFEPPPWHDLVIAEAHVRDLTRFAPVELSAAERMGFAGLRRWVESEHFYLADMGVNAIELQPVHEYDSENKAEYAWGYMPSNYFAPASQYSSAPAKLSQISEFRDLVQAIHARGMAVILDVVYNHIGEPNFFQYLDKEYYFLLDKDGNYQNYSGCGNTFDCNTPMMRRLIRDSLLHWISAYDVDGFRFDLGELIGKETLAWLEDELKAVKPGVILIAEPWSFRGHIATQLRETGFASWNDGYREYVREYLTLQNDGNRLPYYLKASFPEWTRFPAQSVNYVDSHDDRCWIDKITEQPHFNGYHPTANDRRRTHLMVSVLMMSLGIPMLSSGVDFMKSKDGVNNTYLDGDRNALPYSRRSEFSGTAYYFRKWITFRLSATGQLLRLAEYPGERYFKWVQAGQAWGCVVNADYSRGSSRLLYVINPTFDYVTIEFGDMDLSGAMQLADTESWGDPYLYTPTFLVGKHSVQVPRLSCGLFAL